MKIGDIVKVKDSYPVENQRGLTGRIIDIKDNVYTISFESRGFNKEDIENIA